MSDQEYILSLVEQLHTDRHAPKVLSGFLTLFDRRDPAVAWAHEALHNYLQRAKRKAER